MRKGDRECLGGDWKIVVKEDCSEGSIISFDVLIFFLFLLV